MRGRGSNRGGIDPGRNEQALKSPPGGRYVHAEHTLCHGDREYIECEAFRNRIAKPYFIRCQTIVE